MNPEFAVDRPGAAGEEAVAREIANEVACLYDGVERFQLIQIRLTRRVGTPLALSAGATYGFRVADLTPQCDPD
jgi:hypothetical protein